jgi:hypothetical protein
MKEEITHFLIQAREDLAYNAIGAHSLPEKCKIIRLSASFCVCVPDEAAGKLTLLRPRVATAHPFCL